MSLSPIELRHTLHKNPELAFNEVKTSKLLIDNIKGLDNSSKIRIHTPYKTGLLVEHKVNEGNFILFRADIDALPIKEENEIEFKSTNNFMHACGHDVHTSILYSFLSEVLKTNVDQNILFLFQPAEEAGGGAMEFYKTGIFENFNISKAFALHVTDEYKEGTIGSTEGVLFASALEIDIHFIGVSAHVAFPKEGKNAFNTMRKFLDIIDEQDKKNSEPFIFGIGIYNAGNVRNISPGKAKLSGTIRGLSQQKVLSYVESLKVILNKLREETGADFSITLGAHYPEVIVNKTLFNELYGQLSKKFDFIDCGYKMTGEDFGFFSHKFPSFMFWLGTSSGERFGLHNSRFLPPDSIIETGKNIFSEILILQKG
ncbi:MAG: amidohydrolase [Ignavibacteriaceae bacterium]